MDPLVYYAVGAVAILVAYLGWYVYLGHRSAVLEEGQSANLFYHGRRIRFEVTTVAPGVRNSRQDRIIFGHQCPGKFKAFYEDFIMQQEASTFWLGTRKLNVRVTNLGKGQFRFELVPHIALRK